ncbi:MAG TPA: AMP-binding protein [Candidatus Lustribacter sp.]|jgi:malonyl-CoA/methylmalonyl-CoA synthetase|nr:AMP-binding protein [Candidatus Lustribacter sp.]
MAVALGTEPFIDVVRRVAAQRADAPALDELSYADLWRQTGRVARRLAERGVERGDRVAIYSENRRGFVLAYLALLRSGAIAVPTNVLYRAADLGNILSDARPRLVIGSSQTRAHVPADVTFIDAAEVEAWATDASVPADFADVPVGPDDVAIMIYTSGTTGRAKGALITHGNLAAIAAQVGAAWHWTNADTLLITLPLFHIHGLGAGLNGTLAAGAHAILRERFDVNDVVRLLQSGAVTMFFGVPTMYVRFIEKIPPQTFPHVRLFVSGSAALPADVHRAFEEKFGASILERYGSTEFGFPLGNRYEGPRIVGSVGVPMPGVEVTIVAPKTIDRVAPGEVGELLVSGPNVCHGYWDRPEAMADAFVDFDGRRWFRSGDSMRFDPENGVYVVMGRLKELIISGGFNVYPLEVEAEMRLYPGVRDAALVGLDDPARGEIPVAFIEADPGFDADAFVAALRDRLASFKLPKAVRVVDALPRNAMGKVEKQRLKSGAEVGL